MENVGRIKLIKDIPYGRGSILPKGTILAYTGIVRDDYGKLCYYICAPFGIYMDEAEIFEPKGDRPLSTFY